MVVTNAGKAEIAGLILIDTEGALAAFDAIAIGTDATAAAATQTALGAEITTNGGSRRGAGNVTGTRVTTTVTNDTSQLATTFTFTGSFGINEVGVFNNNTSGGTMLLRQVFGSVLNVVNTDTLSLTIKVQHT